MKTVPLGATGVNVSALCLGTMYFGTKNDEASSFRLLDAYVDAGGAFLDTANTYSHWVPGGHGGESERLLGRWLKARKHRKRLFIASKVAFSYAGTTEDPGAERGLRASQIATECEKSLRRMGIDTIDLYYAHHDDRATPHEETLEAFDRLVRAGKVRFLGASNHFGWRVADALSLSRSRGWSAYAVVQQKHSYLRPNEDRDFKFWPPASYEFLQMCQDKRLGVVAYSPLLRGAYSRADRNAGEMYDSPQNRARLETVAAVAGEKGATPAQVVLAWMLHSTPQVIPLFSASTVEQLTEDLGAVTVTLSEADMARLNQGGQAKA